MILRIWIAQDGDHDGLPGHQCPGKIGELIDQQNMNSHLSTQWDRHLGCSERKLYGSKGSITGQALTINHQALHFGWRPKAGSICCTT